MRETETVQRRLGTWLGPRRYVHNLGEKDVVVVCEQTREGALVERITAAGASA